MKEIVLTGKRTKDGNEEVAVQEVTRLRPRKTSLKVNDAVSGEPMWRKVQRIMNNKEPIESEVDLIYTDRADGVKPEYNIRTDRFDLALDATAAVEKDNAAKRDAAAKAKAEEENPPGPTPDETITVTKPKKGEDGKAKS